MNNARSSPILCGTDFSSNAERAATVGAKLALRLGVDLVLAHGIDEQGEIPEHHRGGLIDVLRPRLEKEAARLRALGVTVSEQLLRGVPDDGVAQCAERVGARFIVLAASGHGALGRWILGSVSERIAQSASVPTLVVRGADALDQWADGARPLKVFVATDFTNTADAAVAWAGGLRRIGRCEITLGFVERKRTQSGADLALAESPGVVGMESEEKKRLERDLRRRARELLGDEDPRVVVAAGRARVDAQILKHATEAGAELIVLGTHQWHGVDRLQRSSVSRRILRDAPVAVACVPVRGAADLREPLRRVRTVLVATDLSPHASGAVPLAYSIVADRGQVCLLFVKTPADDEVDIGQLRALIPPMTEPQEVASEVRIESGTDVAAIICEVADRIDADVICVGSHGRSGLTAAVLGSVAHSVVAHSTRPVLVVRAQG